MHAHYTQLKYGSRPLTAKKLYGQQKYLDFVGCLKYGSSLYLFDNGHHASYHRLNYPLDLRVQIVSVSYILSPLLVLLAIYSFN